MRIKQYINVIVIHIQFTLSHDTPWKKISYSIMINKVTNTLLLVCRMIELDEAIEALEAAIEYKNDNINSRKLELRHSQILSQVRQIPRSQAYCT